MEGQIAALRRQVELERELLEAQLEALAAERERADGLARELAEIARAASGLSTRKLDREKPAEPMPRDIVEAIESWQGDGTRANLQREAWNSFHRTGKWDQVRASLFDQTAFVGPESDEG